MLPHCAFLRGSKTRWDLHSKSWPRVDRTSPSWGFSEQARNWCCSRIFAHPLQYRLGGIHLGHVHQGPALKAEALGEVRGEIVEGPRGALPGKGLELACLTHVETSTGGVGAPHCDAIALKQLGSAFVSPSRMFSTCLHPPAADASQMWDSPAWAWPWLESFSCWWPLLRRRINCGRPLRSESIHQPAGLLPD